MYNYKRHGSGGIPWRLPWSGRSVNIILKESNLWSPREAVGTNLACGRLK